MSEVTIDQLQIEISSDSADAIKSIKKLEKTLNKLKSTVSGGLGLKSFAQEFKDLSTASSSIDNNSSNKLEKLLQSLEKLKSASGVKISTNIANPILEIAKAIKSVDNNTYTKLGRFSESLKKIGVIKGSISANYGNQIERIGNALKLIDSNSIYKLDALAVSLKGFSSIGKSNLSGLITNLSKLPSVYEGFKDIDVKAFAEDMRLLSDALIPLASNIDKIGRGFSNLPTKVRSLVNISPKLVASNKSVSRSFDNMLGKIKKSIQAVVFSYEAFKMLGRTLGYFVEKSTSYVENLNLFHASMGRFGKEAEEYADIVNKALGIDKSEWIRNQGIFMTLATGFGVVEERAYRMSRNLTQLGYDISSFFNISFADAMTKLQSGMSGELEPLRRLGYDLSQAKLKAVALSLGIDKTFESMTQAEKAQLRYHAIMTQVTASHGDLARTLNTPANQLRIMKTLFQQAGRAIGDIFIPALNAILPVAIAVLKVVRELADHIALMFGFQLPKIDYSGIEHSSGAVDGLTDSLDNATKSAKALKSATLGFDELNVISPSPSSGGNGGAGGANGGWKDFPLEEYDFLGKSKIKEHLNAINPIVQTIKDNMSFILTTVKAIGAAFITWKSVKYTENLATKILGDIDTKKWNQVAIGLTVTVASMTFLSDGIKGLVQNGPNFEDILKTLLGGVGMAIGIKTIAVGLGASGVFGWTIGIGLTVAFGVFKFIDEWNKEQIKRDLKTRFGEISLTEAEINELAKDIMKSPVTAELDVIIDQQKASKQAHDKLQESMNTIEKLKVKMQFDLNYDKDTLLNAAKELVSNMGSFLDEKQTELLMSFKHVFKDTQIGNYLITQLNGFFSGENEKLSSLGSQLKQTISEGFVNGEWIPDKKAEAMRLMAEIQEIQSKFKMGYAKAKIDHYSSQLASGRLDQRSTELAQKELDKAKQEYFVAENEIQIQMKISFDIIEAETNVNPDVMENARKSLEAKTNENQMEIALNNINFGLDEFYSSFETEIKSVRTNMYDTFKYEIEAYKEEIQPVANGVYDVFIPDYEKIAALDTWEKYFYRYKGSFEEGLKKSGITDTQKSAMAEMLKILNVDEHVEDLKKLVDNARALGVAVPENVSKGLMDLTQAQALSGNANAMMYNLGMQMTSSPEFFTMMKNINDMGAKIPTNVADGIKANLTYSNEGGQLVVTSISEGTKIALGEVTPKLKENFLDLGIDITKSLHKGADEMMDKVDFKGTMEKVKTTSKSVLDFKSFLNIGENIVNGLFNGISNLLKKNDYGKNIFEKVTNTVKKAYAIHSPSKVFEEIGEYVGEGLYLGMDNKIEKVKGVYNNVPDSFKNGFQVQMADIFKNIATAIFQNMESGFKQIQELFGKLPGWMDLNVSSKMKSIFDGMIGNLKSQINSASSMLGSLQSQMNSTFFEGGIDGYNHKAKGLESPESWMIAGTKHNSHIPVFYPDGRVFMSKGKYTHEGKTYESSTPSYWMEKDKKTGQYRKMTKRATGGLPPIGEIFIARESGPEMVGKMGNSSAVANNEQIVDGIAKGVANANSEQNQLLREQNQLLKALLNKDTGFRLDGKSLSKSIEKYQNERGYQLVTGGV